MKSQAGEITLKPEVIEGYQADIGEIVVPENRANEKSRLIRLPVVRVHSVRFDPGEPVFMFEGGPGLPNIKLQQLPQWLLANHDVVMVGYRGVDGSSALQAPEINTLFKQQTDLLGHDSMQSIGTTLTNVALRLQGEGVDLAGYGVIDVVDDMEDVRQALGYARINLIGGSYGGAVAYVYCIRYPESIHRCIITEGAFPFNVGMAEPEGVDSKLHRLNELWQMSERVAEVEDIVTTIKHVMATLPSTWHGITIDPGRIKLMIYMGMYTHETTAQFCDAFVAAEQGDYSGLAFMHGMWEQIVDWFNWGDMCAKLYSTRTGPERDYEQELDPPGSIIGAPLAKLGWGPTKYASWPAKPLPEKHRAWQHSSVETLLIYGSHESAPYSNMAYFDNGNLVVMGDAGHMEVTAEQPEASEHLQARFLLEGVIDKSKFQDTSPVPKSFTPQQSFQSLAKAMIKANSE